MQWTSLGAMRRACCAGVDAVQAVSAAECERTHLQLWGTKYNEGAS